MTENTKINFNDSQKIAEYCNATLDGLEKFHDQLIKIIEVKKKLSANQVGNIALNQAQDTLNAISNLEKINSRLVSAINEVRQLTQNIILLLQPIKKTKG